MKLVWMVLFALPLISLTACGDDDEDNDLFKDYSYLINKTRDDVKKNLGVAPAEEDLESLVYENIQPNIPTLIAWFTLWEENETGLVTYEKVQMVDVELKGLSYSEVYNHLTDLYGKAELDDYDDMRWEKSGKYIWLDQDGSELWVTYADKKAWDKAEEAYYKPAARSAESVSPKAAHRAARATR